MNLVGNLLRSRRGARLSQSSLLAVETGSAGCIAVISKLPDNVAACDNLFSGKIPIACYW
ncbi:MAG: hypothetical protein LBS77_05790 [Desulfovibrio sp.]|nr:hypothetical protein [Desulfovibrio sp.]